MPNAAWSFDPAMNLVGLMVVRNEDWVLGLSLRAALMWCDSVVVLDHASDDGTSRILAEVEIGNPGRVRTLYQDDDRWEEMRHRQMTLEAGRAAGGTHFAIIDADEVLTGNHLPTIRDRVADLGDGELLDVPMVPLWRCLDRWRDDRSVWTRAKVTIAFRDAHWLHWRAGPGGYDHHHRAPYGHGPRRLLMDRGVMHLQFANWRRLVAKHCWYRMTERMRWPDREPAYRVEHRYAQATDESGLCLSDCDPAWWKPYVDFRRRGLVDLHGVPWHEAECRRMWNEHGPEPFRGLRLDLRGPGAVV